MKRRGWWGSYLLDDYVGFQGWTCFQEAADTSTLVDRLTNYTQMALQHLVTAGVAQSVDVTVSLTGHLKAIILITINQPDGNQQTYSVLWTNLN
jgi:phage gp46-like protein